MQSPITVGAEVRCRMNGLVGQVVAQQRGGSTFSRMWVVAFPQRDTAAFQERDLDLVS